MDDERIDEIFDRIGEMDIELDYDPIKRGPKHLNNMVARCRNYTNETQRFMREVQMELRTLERALHIQQAEFKLMFNDLMANDEEIRQMRGLSRADREALANTKLEEEVRLINDLEGDVTDLKHVETVLDSKLRELRDVNRDIRLQKQLIQAEIETGAMWGNDHGPQDSFGLANDAEDLDPADMFEQPEEEEEEEDEDYIDLFLEDDDEILAENDGEDEILATNDKDPEKVDPELDSDGEAARVRSASRDKDRPDINEATGIMNDDTGEMIDFSAALQSLG